MPIDFVAPSVTDYVDSLDDDDEVTLSSLSQTLRQLLNREEALRKSQSDAKKSFDQALLRTKESIAEESKAHEESENSLQQSQTRTSKSSGFFKVSTMGRVQSDLDRIRM